MMENISIFVPVYFREKTVRRCVDALVETTDYPDDDYKTTIVLVDNRSNRTLRDYLIKLFHAKASRKHVKVELILLDHNFGKAQAIMHAVKAYPNFDWFINFDSDIFPTTPQWHTILTRCYANIEQAGMVSTNYVRDANNPMPNQPHKITVETSAGNYTFHYGGQVAGGVFVSHRDVWDYVGYKRNQGVYGGIDGLYRQTVADIMHRKCGFIEEVQSVHVDDRDENKDYNAWKLAVQNKIKRYGPLANPKLLGNDKGFFDEKREDEE
jgi:glycosyltransferase involved in cell wall biosynthesis